MIEFTVRVNDPIASELRQVFKAYHLDFTERDISIDRSIEDAIGYFWAKNARENRAYALIRTIRDLRSEHYMGLKAAKIAVEDWLEQHPEQKEISG